ncbi:MAG: hypothetical protein U0169_12080 [Polyangiaceae bacterium]
MPYLPTRRLAGLAFATVAIALAAAITPAARGPLWAVDVLVVVLVAVDFAFARGRRVEASRDVAAILSVGRPNPVTLTFRNTGSRTLSLVVSDDPVEDGDADGLPATPRPRAAGLRRCVTS